MMRSQYPFVPSEVEGRARKRVSTSLDTNGYGRLVTTALPAALEWIDYFGIAVFAVSGALLLREDAAAQGQLLEDGARDRLHNARAQRLAVETPEDHTRG